jgi:hypothetical protein
MRSTSRGFRSVLSPSRKPVVGGRGFLTQRYSGPHRRIKSSRLPIPIGASMAIQKIEANNGE